MTKRIALISEHASPLGVCGGVDRGGQNVYVGQVAKQLAALGYQVEVLARWEERSQTEIVEWHNGVRIIAVPAGPPVYLSKEKLLPYMGGFRDYAIARIDAGEGYDLIHANFWMSGLVAAEIKQQRGIPFVITFHALGRVRRLHQGAADGFPDERLAIEERIVAEADCIIAECPQDREDLLSLYGADPQRIRIIPCGFDPGEFWPVNSAKARAILGLPQNENLILQLGRLVPRKGVDNVLRGFACLRQQYEVSARLLIVGGDSPTPNPQITPEIGRLQRLAQSLGVGQSVTFFGHRDRLVLKYFYSAADVFVTTPWYEPFGITPLEAMACGTPAIGAAVGGIKFTVRDGETGYLVPPNEPEILGDRLAKLSLNPQLRHLFGQQALRHVQQAFTWSRVVGEIAALYEAILAGEADYFPKSSPPSALIEQSFNEAIQTLQKAKNCLNQAIMLAVRQLKTCFARGGKVLICGNGGSAAESQHLAAELVGRFRFPGRGGLPAIALTADSAFLTAWSNDIGYSDVFARQVKTFAQSTDVLVGISTSGRSANVVAAFKVARQQNMATIALLGGDGGDLLNLADIAIVVPSRDPQRIQEVQLLLVHLLCDLLEEQLLTPREASENVWMLTDYSANSRDNPPAIAKVKPMETLPLVTKGLSLKEN
ncbi:MAG: glycosyltransferase [Chloroflexaceae bacterium]|nr:glycosyltransferase [Chloroflexaceae bacterium]